MSKILLLLLLLFISSFVSFGQIVRNGSFEGLPSGTAVPIGWYICRFSTTVDIQPGYQGVNLPPPDGDSYIDMVCRGRNYPNAETCEELGQDLTETLKAGKCYRVGIYLAFTRSFSSLFRTPLDLRLSGGVTGCNKDEEIAVYDSIDHFDWKKYTRYYSPSVDINTIWLEADFNGPDSYFGVILMDNLSIEEVPVPETQLLSICENEKLTLKVSITEDVESYNWNNGATGEEIEITEAGTYTVDMTLGECTIRETFIVSLQEAPILELTPDPVVCRGSEIILDAYTENGQYLWQDGSTASNFTVKEAGTYSVTLTIDQCVSSHTVTIVFDNCEAILEMPNAFTPNNDTKNDLFTPIRVFGITSMQTVIYNRWGENIYTTNNLNIEWNGHLPSDEPAPASTYYWRISYTDVFGEKHNQKGTVTLMR